MPLSVNVGLSRKASKDYQSTGYSINVTAELDQSLLARPDELQQQIDSLYQHAEIALSKQAGEQQVQRQDHRPVRQPYRSGNGSNGNGNGNGNGNANGNDHSQPRSSNGPRSGAMMTVSQRRAIIAIARRNNTDPEADSRDIIGAALDDLTLQQASELIDHLKSLQPSNGRNGGGR